MEEENKKWGGGDPDEKCQDENASSIKKMQENAKRTAGDRKIKSPNMDPDEEGTETQKTSPEKTEDWQQLNRKEERITDSRKGGYPKNTGQDKPDEKKNL